MRVRSVIWTLLLLLTAGACTRMVSDEGTGEKLDCWTLSVSGAVDAGFEGTKAVEDGDVFHNLVVLLVRDGVVMRKATWTPETDEYVGTRSVEFRGIEVGSYDVYALANYDATAWPYVAAAEASVAVGASFNANRVLSVTPPESLPANTPMLLTGHSVVAVDVANSLGTLKLYRPLARFRVWINNHTPYPLEVNSLSFNSFNASQTYVFGRTTESGVLSMPTGTSLNALPAYAPESTLVVASGGRVRAYNHLFYEMRMAVGYVCRMYAKVTMRNGTTNPPSMEMGTPGTGVIMKLIDNETSQVSALSQLWRNQEVNVEVNVYYKTVEGVPQLVVENSTWEGSGHYSSHTYGQEGD